MSSKWIKKGDKVLVNCGNDKGKIGEVLGRRDSKVIVQGINVRKKHMRRREQNAGGQIISMEKPIHISNVTLCDADGTLLKLHTKQSKGSKELVHSKNNSESVYRTVKKSRK